MNPSETVPLEMNWPIISIDIDVSDTLLAVGQNHVDKGFNLSIMDLSKRRQLVAFRAPREHISTLKFIPDQDLLCFITSGNVFNIIELSVMKISRSFDIGSNVNSVLFKKNYSIFVGKFLEIWDWIEEEKAWVLEDYESGIVTYNWDYNELDCTWECSEHIKNKPYFNRPAHAVFTELVNEIFICGNNTAKIFKYNWRENIFSQINGDAPLQVSNVSCSTNSGFLCISGVIPDGDFLFNMKTGDRVLNGLFNEQMGASKVSAFHPVKNIIARGFHFGHVLMNNIENGETVFFEKLHNGDVSSICFNTKGNQLYSAGVDGKLFTINL